MAPDDPWTAPVESLWFPRGLLVSLKQHKNPRDVWRAWRKQPDSLVVFPRGVHKDYLQAAMAYLPSNAQTVLACSGSVCTQECKRVIMAVELPALSDTLLASVLRIATNNGFKAVWLHKPSNWALCLVRNKLQAWGRADVQIILTR
jgi:hypothetical protein